MLRRGSQNYEKSETEETAANLNPPPPLLNKNIITSLFLLNISSQLNCLSLSFPSVKDNQ